MPLSTFLQILRKPPTHCQDGCSPLKNPAHRPAVAVHSHRAAQNIKERPAQRPEPIGRAKGIAFRVMQWLVLCGIPYRGPGARDATSTDPTNQLPTSHLGQAQWPPGGSTARFATF
jgi:hypothetical protein